MSEQLAYEAPTVLLVVEETGLRARVAPIVLDLGHHLATCTWRKLERRLEERPKPPAAVVAAARDETDGFRVLAAVRRSGRDVPVVLVARDPQVLEHLRSLEPAAVTASPADLERVLHEVVPPSALAC